LYAYFARSSFIVHHLSFGEHIEYRKAIKNN